MQAKSLDDCFDWSTVEINIDGKTVEEVDQIESCWKDKFEVPGDFESDNALLKMDAEWAL